jgi:hypothetical protein
VQFKTAGLGPFVFGGDLLLTSRSSRLLLAFPPIKAKALRLTLLEGHRYFGWSFNELDLLGPGRSTPRRP